MGEWGNGRAGEWESGGNGRMGDVRCGRGSGSRLASAGRLGCGWLCRRARTALPLPRSPTLPLSHSPFPPLPKSGGECQRQRRQQVDGDGQADGVLGAQEGQKQEAAQERADDGAHRVGRVGIADAPAHLPERGGIQARDDRERGPHQERGRQHDGETHRELEELQRPERGGIHLVGREEVVGQVAQGKRNHQRCGGDAGLKQGEGGQWPAPAVHDTGAEGGAGGQPAEERREHGGEGIDGRAEHQRQRARPRHLVDQSGKPGQAVGHEQERQGGRRRSRGRSAGRSSFGQSGGRAGRQVSQGSSRRGADRCRSRRCRRRASQ